MLRTSGQHFRVGNDNENALILPPKEFSGVLQCYSKVQWPKPVSQMGRKDRSAHVQVCVRVYVRVHAHVLVLYRHVWVCTGQRKTKSFNFLLRFVWEDLSMAWNLPELAGQWASWLRLSLPPSHPCWEHRHVWSHSAFVGGFWRLQVFTWAAGFWIRFLMLLRQACSWWSHLPCPPKDVAFSTFKVKLSRVKR